MRADETCSVLADAGESPPSSDVRTGSATSRSWAPATAHLSASRNGRVAAANRYVRARRSRAGCGRRRARAASRPRGCRAAAHCRDVAPGNTLLDVDAPDLARDRGVLLGHVGRPPNLDDRGLGRYGVSSSTSAAPAWPSTNRRSSVRRPLEREQVGTEVAGDDEARVGARPAGARRRTSCPGSRRRSRGRTAGRPRPPRRPPARRGRQSTSFDASSTAKVVAQERGELRPAGEPPLFRTPIGLVGRQQGLLRSGSRELPDLIGEPTQREQPGVHRPPIGIFVFEELADAVPLLGRGEHPRRRLVPELLVALADDVEREPLDRDDREPGERDVRAGRAARRGRGRGPGRTPRRARRARGRRRSRSAWRTARGARRSCRSRTRR